MSTQAPFERTHFSHPEDQPTSPNSRRRRKMAFAIGGGAILAIGGSSVVTAAIVEGARPVESSNTTDDNQPGIDNGALPPVETATPTPVESPLPTVSPSEIPTFEAPEVQEPTAEQSTEKTILTAEQVSNMTEAEIKEYATIRFDDVSNADGTIDAQKYYDQLTAIRTSQINSGSTAFEMYETLTNPGEDIDEKYNRYFTSGYATKIDAIEGIYQDHLNIILANQLGFIINDYDETPVEKGSTLSSVTSGTYTATNAEVIAWNGRDTIIGADVLYTDNMFSSGNIDPTEITDVERLGRTEDANIITKEQLVLNNINGVLVVVGTNN